MLALHRTDFIFIRSMGRKLVKRVDIPFIIKYTREREIKEAIMMTAEDRAALYLKLKTDVFKAWDAGFAEGLEPAFMLADTKDYANQGDGDSMDHVLDLFMDDWKTSRGV